MPIRKSSCPRLTVLALAVGLGLSHPALAGNFRWNGSQGANWNTLGSWDWDGYGPPGSGDTATFDLISAPVASLGSTTTINFLVLGGGSEGRLNITAGGSLTTGSALMGNSAGANGVLSVSGSGAAFIVSTGALTLGNEGSAALTVEQGASASVTSGPVYIGATAGGSGTLTLQTGGSFDAGTGTLYVGYGSSGTIEITEGHLESDSAHLGDGVGSSGEVSLSGSNSSWNNSGALAVGVGGTGTLSLSGGASVTTQSATVASAAGLASAITVTSGSQLTINDAFYLGLYGDGSLTVESGGSVSSGDTLIARYASSTSTALVSGGSWTTGRLIMGGDPFDNTSTGGSATLTVEDGGSLNTGAVLLGGAAAGSGSVTVDDATWTASDRISVGYAGSGALTVSNGATVTSTGGLVGHLAGSTGEVTITTGNWINSGVLYVGNEGEGTLTVSANGMVSSTDGYVGVANGAVGEVHLSGGSSWTNSGDLLVGQSGGASGEVTVTGGSTLTAGAQTILGDLVSSHGSLTVSGNGSSVTAGQDFNVGRFGTGTLLVSGGATVSGNRVYIANEGGSSGSAVVTGSGSHWSSTHKLHVGLGGSGELTVSDGGTVSATELGIATQAGSTGVLNLGAAAGAAAQAAGVLDTTSIAFGAGNGTLNLNYLGSYTLAAALSGSGAINQLAGNTTLSGNSSAFAGLTTVSGGTLTVDGSLGGTLQVASGGTLSGSGTVGSTTVAAGGVLALDAPGSALHVDGDLTLASGSLYRVHTTTSGLSDAVVVDGNAFLAGGLSVLAGSAEYTANTRYTILSASGLVSGSFSSVSSDFAFVTPVVRYDDQLVELTLTPNGAGYASVSTTPNQAGVANALTAAALSVPIGSEFDQVLSRIDTLSTAQAQVAFDSMSGRAHLGLANLGVLSSTIQTLGSHNIGGAAGGAPLLGFNASEPVLLAANAQADTMSDVGGGLGLRLRPQRERGYMWAQVVGGHGNTRSDGNAAGYKSDSSGLLLGADSRLSERLAVGLAYQYNETRLDYATAGSDDARVRGHQLAAYGSYEVDDWRFRAIAAYGWNDYHTSRDILIGSDVTRATADYDGREAGLFVEAAYRIDRGGYVLEPALSLQNVVLKQDGFREKGAGALGLDADGQTTRSLVSMLGGRLQVPLNDGGLTGELRAFWAHQWADRGSEMEVAFQGAPGVDFRVGGLKQEHDSAVLGFGLKGKASERLALALDYNLGVDERQTQHTLIAGLKYQW